MPDISKLVEIDHVREKLVELFLSVPPVPVFAVKRNGKQHFVAEHYADHLIANGVTVQEWIPVTERLPTHREWVLVWHTGYKTPKKAFYKDDLAPYLPIFRLDGDNGIHGEVTHWQPLPQPPKGD